MEVMLDIKNVPKVMKPTEDDVIVFNGKQWYITSKESLLKDAYKLLENCKQELEKIKQENKDFKNEVNKQLVFMRDAIKALYEVNK